MIWFDLKELESKISKNELTEKDGFNYLLAYGILSCIAVGSSKTYDANEWFELIETALCIIIAIWGIKATYKANNEYDGNDFLKRFLAISWVIGFRVFLTVLGIAFAVGIVVAILTVADSDLSCCRDTATEFLSVITTTIVSIVYFWLILRSFGRLKSMKE
jgi:hypothetical protein